MKINSPITGISKKIIEVDDPVFSQKMMGDGIAITPTLGELKSPIDGKISMLFQSNHAIGITNDDGVEILLHIGIDTVELNGEYFQSFVKEGDIVKQGDLLINFDFEEIKKKGYDIDTMMVFTNMGNYQGLINQKIGTVDFSDVLLEIQ